MNKTLHLLFTPHLSHLQTPGRGGGTLIFSSYVGSGSASTIHPQKYQEFQAPQKTFDILATQKISPILYPDLKKRH